MSTIKLTIDGMTCGGCSASLTGLLLREPGITGANVSHAEGFAEVTFDEAIVGEQRLGEIVEEAGFTLT